MMKLTGTFVAGLSTATSAAWIGRSPGVCVDALPVSPRTPAAAADSIWPRKSRRVMADIARPRCRDPTYRNACFAFAITRVARAGDNQGFEEISAGRVVASLDGEKHMALAITIRLLP